jgi:hypothetical protein
MRELQINEQVFVSGGTDGDDEEIVVTAPPWTEADELEYMNDIGCTTTVATSMTLGVQGSIASNGPSITIVAQVPASTLTCPVGFTPWTPPASPPPPIPRDPYLDFL